MIQALRNSVFARIFWTHLHRSNDSAAFRWRLTIFASIAAMPVFGSLFSGLMVLSTIVGLIYLVLAPDRFRMEPHERQLFVAFSAYFAVTLASVLLHPNASEGLSKAVAALGMPLMALLLPVLRDAYRDSWSTWFIGAISLAGVLIGLGSWIELTVAPTTRTEAFVGNSLVFSYMAGVVALFSLVLVMALTGIQRLLVLVSLFGSLLGLLFAGSRAPIAYVVFLGVIITAVHGISFRHRSWKAILLIAYLSICAGAILYESIDDTRAFQWLVERTIALKEVTNHRSMMSVQGDEGRLHMLRVGWDAFLDAPIFGHGPQNVISAANAQAPWSPALRVTHLHNAYLTEAVASGVLGLLALIALIAIPAIAIRDAGPPWSVMTLVLCSYTALYMLTNIGFHHDLISFYFTTTAMTMHVIGFREQMVRETEFLAFSEARLGGLPVASLSRPGRTSPR